MTVKDLKIPVDEDIKQQFDLAKAEMGSTTHEEALVELILRCSKNGELNAVDEGVLNGRLQERY